jgi:lambda family phage portal protein
VSGLLDSRGSPINSKTQGRKVEFRYDAASTGNRDDAHWDMIDGLSAAAANDPAVRKRVRERARYEVSNNSHCSASIATFVADVCGSSGPKLNLVTEDITLAETVEKAWRRWWRAAGLSQMLQTARRSQAVDGEVFALLTSNPAIRNPVKLSLRLIETDQVSLPWSGVNDDSQSDGIKYDEFGNPTAYYVLRRHPGDTAYYGPQDGVWIDAARICHLYAVTRPGQVRGISELVSSLRLFGDLRRYRSATVAAAEIAASVSLWLKAAVMPDADGPSAGDSYSIRHGEMGVLPPGSEVQQLRSEIPTTTYTDFHQSLIVESGRAMSLPRGKSLGSFADYNFSSARLELLNYQPVVDTDRMRLEAQLLDSVYEQWLEEAIAVGEVPVEAIEVDQQFCWPGMPLTDPHKESTAETVRLAANTTTLARIYGRQGLDYEVELRQRAKERQLIEELGLSDAEVITEEDDDAES